jgi:hypothetical protein
MDFTMCWLDDSACGEPQHDVGVNHRLIQRAQIRRRAHVAAQAGRGGHPGPVMHDAVNVYNGDIVVLNAQRFDQLEHGQSPRRRRRQRTTLAGLQTYGLSVHRR